MSRYYGMSIVLSGVKSEKIDPVKQAAEAEWAFDSWFCNRWGPRSHQLITSGNSNLCGETEEEFAERLARAIWAANGEYCEVEVNATFLEELPYETYCFDQEDYDLLVNASGSKTPTEEDTPDGQ